MVGHSLPLFALVRAKQPLVHARPLGMRSLLNRQHKRLGPNTYVRQSGVVENPSIDAAWVGVPRSFGHRSTLRSSIFLGAEQSLHVARDPSHLRFPWSRLPGLSEGPAGPPRKIDGLMEANEAPASAFRFVAERQRMATARGGPPAPCLSILLPCNERHGRSGIAPSRLGSLPRQQPDHAGQHLPRSPHQGDSQCRGRWDANQCAGADQCRLLHADRRGQHEPAIAERLSHTFDDQAVDEADRTPEQAEHTDNLEGANCPGRAVAAQRGCKGTRLRMQAAYLPVERRETVQPQRRPPGRERREPHPPTHRSRGSHCTPKRAMAQLAAMPTPAATTPPIPPELPLPDNRASPANVEKTWATTSSVRSIVAVASCSKGTRDLLRSLGWNIGHSMAVITAAQ